MSVLSGEVMTDVFEGCWDIEKQVFGGEFVIANLSLSEAQTHRLAAQVFSSR